MTPEHEALRRLLEARHEARANELMAGELRRIARTILNLAQQYVWAASRCYDRAMVHAREWDAARSDRGGWTVALEEAIRSELEKERGA
jgi:hypothetical protein